MSHDQILKTESLTINFGGLCAVDSVDMHVRKGEIVGLIGPNGSGKSTFFNLITGIYQPTNGTIFFKGENLVGKKAHQIAKKGVARTFQNNRLFSDISVLDNVILGMHYRQKTNLLDTLFRYRLVKAELRAGAERAMGLLSFFSEDLKANWSRQVAELPHADRRRVEICRALASDPDLLLLDEPAGGMSPEETGELMSDIRKVKETHKDLSVIIIEHDMAVIEQIAERVYVFNYGKKIAEGSYSLISKNPGVIQAYLGEEEEDAAA